MSASPRIAVEQLLRRIDERIGALESFGGGPARTVARDLLEAVLDLHGSALASIAARLCASREGRAIYDALGRDETVRAVLLLHNLHPEPAEDRIRAAAAEIANSLGVAIEFVSVSDRIARLCVDPSGRDWPALCRDIASRMTDAAPDLDDIAVERASLRGFAAAAG